MNKMKEVSMRIAMISCLGFGLSVTAHSSIILIGANPVSGSGLGAVSTVLTIQSQGQNQAESGCIAPTGSASCGFANNTVQSGQSQVQTVTGISAANMRFVFNASEPGQDNLVTLNNLVASFYNASGAVIYQTSGIRLANGTLVNPAVGVNFDPFSGTGNSGYLFRLTTAADGIPGDDQASALQAAIAAQGAGASVRIGFGASLTNAAAGLETFSVRAFTTGTPGADPVPEPATSALVGLGLIAAAYGSRKLSKSSS